MTTRQPIVNNGIYESTELKLCALIISELSSCTFEISEQVNSLRKIIRIKYPVCYQEEISKLEKAFINKEALTNVYRYNKSLNMIRDRLRGD